MWEISKKKKKKSVKKLNSVQHLHKYDYPNIIKLKILSGKSSVPAYNQRRILRINCYISCLQIIRVNLHILSKNSNI